MEGRKALPQPNVWKKMPQLCAGMFCLGMVLEWALCKSGFYSYLEKSTQVQMKKTEIEDAEFWKRVHARREAKRAAGLIQLEKS